VAARFVHQRAAEMILMSPGPLATLEHGAALWGRPAVEDESQGFSGGVGI
jgi:hypothetical protein